MLPGSPGVAGSWVLALSIMTGSSYEQFSPSLQTTRKVSDLNLDKFKEV